MGSVGKKSLEHSMIGINSTEFFDNPMSPRRISNPDGTFTDYLGQVPLFESKISPDDNAVLEALKDYAYGTYGDSDEKAEFDRTNGISEFIDRARQLKVTNNPTLYRGVVLSDSELAALKPGALAPKDTFTGLTSWSTREIVSHMYAEGDSSGYTMGDKKGNPVVFIDTGKTNDGIVYPYTYPQNEVLRSKKYTYEIVRVVPASQYTKPIGRENTADADNTYYTEPVTYVYVKRIPAK